ncbi:MAG TPA: hypothetical protein VIH99_00025 [Bdellovibrionota bacterium]|jgi:hypothetical protein
MQRIKLILLCSLLAAFAAQTPAFAEESKNADGCGGLKVKRGGREEPFKDGLDRARGRVEQICGMNGDAFSVGANQELRKAIDDCNQATRNSMNGSSMIQAGVEALKQKTTEICRKAATGIHNTQDFCREHQQSSAEADKAIRNKAGNLAPSDAKAQAGYQKEIRRLKSIEAETQDKLGKGAAKARDELEEMKGKKGAKGALCQPTKGARSFCPGLRDSVQNLAQLAQKARRAAGPNADRAKLAACSKVPTALKQHLDRMETELMPNVQNVANNLEAVQKGAEQRRDDAVRSALAASDREDDMNSVSKEAMAAAAEKHAHGSDVTGRGGPATNTPPKGGFVRKFADNPSQRIQMPGDKASGAYFQQAGFDSDGTPYYVRMSKDGVQTSGEGTRLYYGAGGWSSIKP